MEKYFYKCKMHFWLLIFSGSRHVSIPHGNGGSVRELAQLSKSLTYTQALSLHQQSQNASHSQHIQQQPSHIHQMPAKRGRGRPRKHPLPPTCEDGSDEYLPPSKKSKTGGRVGGPRGKRQHCKCFFLI